MSCGEMCSTHGCHGGPGCAAHRTHYKPDPVESAWPLRLVDLLLVICTAALICWLLGVFGPALDAHAGEYHEPQALTDAKRAAVMAWRRDMAAAKLCRTERPGSLIHWTVDGQLVCTPVSKS